MFNLLGWVAQSGGETDSDIDDADAARKRQANQYDAYQKHQQWRDATTNSTRIEQLQYLDTNTQAGVNNNNTQRGLPNHNTHHHGDKYPYKVGSRHLSHLPTRSHVVDGVDNDSVINQAPKKNKNSGGSAGIMKQSKRTKIKAFLGVDVDDEFGGKINKNYVYNNPKEIQDKARVIDDIDPGEGFKNGNYRNGEKGIGGNKVLKQKDGDRHRHLAQKDPNTRKHAKQNTQTDNTDSKSTFERPKNPNKVTFDQTKATYSKFENEEDEVLSDMGQVLSRLATNSSTITNSLDKQAHLLSETRRLADEQLGTFKELETKMELIIQKSNCGHYTIVMIELVVIFILFVLINL
jgi:hypothetical protein